MPEGNNNDCETVKFFAPADTFGGPKPVPSCLPGEPRVPDELVEPAGNLRKTTPLLTPPAITTRNRQVIVTCPPGSYGQAIVIAEGAMTDTVPFSAVLSIPDTTLDYIATNNLVDWIDRKIVDPAFKATELARETRMRLSDAKALMEAIRASQDALTDTARLTAEAQLVCYWLNNPQTATCPEPDMAHPEDHPDAVYTVTISAGLVVSYVSQEDADAQAIKMAESSLNCFYVSDPFTALCETRPDRPAEVMEPVPNDVYPVREGLPLRVGSASVIKGQFISRVSKEDANTQAMNYAYSLLVCFYINDPLFEHCEDPNARNRGVNPVDEPAKEADIEDKTKGQYVTVPRGFITSELSTEDANRQAGILAGSLLECCFVNKKLLVECPPYEVVDENGNPRLDENGNPILIPASLTQSPVYSLMVPAGKYQSCESQAIADKLAELALQGQLNCYYCNKIVLPTCVPEWVVQAADTGIVLTDAITLPDGTVMPAGATYRLQLPLNVHNLVNPFTGQLEDLTTWSVDATVGAPAEFVCSPEYPQSQQIAQNAGLEIVDRRPEDASDDCVFVNDLVIAACQAEDPYNPEETTLDHIGVLPTGGAYRFFSKFGPDECLDNKLSNPAPGSYIEIPAGMIAVTAADTPGTRKESDPLYSRDENSRMAKQYANLLAYNMALSMLYCVFSNPLTLGICDAGTSGDLCGDKWTFGANKPSYKLTESSHTSKNPFIVPPRTFLSTISIDDVYNQTQLFVLSSLVCQYCSDPQKASCEPGKSPVNSALIPGCTIVADSLAEANAIAQALSSSMLVCEDNSNIDDCCWNQEQWGECIPKTKICEEEDCVYTMLHQGYCPPHVICAKTCEEANRIAKQIADAMTYCDCVCPGGKGEDGADGPPGPPGEPGAPGSPCAGGCYGLYS